MRPVDQTDMTGETGNCFQACLASLLEKPLDAIPHFMAPDMVENWREHFELWLFRRGMFSVECRIDGNEPIIQLPHKLHCIVSGPSPRFGGLHAVIGLTNGILSPGLELVHDPYHTDRRFYDGKPPTWVMFIGSRNIFGVL